LGGRKGIRSIKKYGGMVEVALVSPDAVAPSRMVGPEVLFGHRLTWVVPEKGRKTVVVVVCTSACFTEVTIFAMAVRQCIGWD